MCLVIFDFMLIIVFEKLFVENVCGLYFFLKRIFFVFFWYMGVLVIYDYFNLNLEFDIFCDEEMI